MKNAKRPFGIWCLALLICSHLSLSTSPALIIGLTKVKYQEFFLTQESARKEIYIREFFSQRPLSLESQTPNHGTF